MFYIWIGIMVAFGNCIADDVFVQVARDFRNMRGTNRIKYLAGVVCGVVFEVTCWPAVLTILLCQAGRGDR